MRRLILAWILAALSGCAGLEPDLEPAPPARADSPATPGLQFHQTLHFTLRGRDLARLRALGDLAEGIYGKVMFDTNLLSFKPRENYPITIFRDAEQYYQETGYPRWSGGGAVTKFLGQVLPSERDVEARTAIYTFETNLSPPVLAHEITHLVFNEFMDFSGSEDAARVRWLNEGLATFEEYEALAPEDREDFLRRTRPLLRANVLPLRDLIEFNAFATPVHNLGSFVLNGKTYLFTNIDCWYWQAESLTDFLIQKGGRYNFFLLMSALKARKDFLSALGEAYPGKWGTWERLESEWRQSL